jgi:pimeloyl-ACP methyl ester carboxylesterase
VVIHRTARLARGAADAGVRLGVRLATAPLRVLPPTRGLAEALQPSEDPLRGHRWLAEGVGTLAVSTVAAPVVAVRDRRRMDPGALDPPVPPVGEVRRVVADDGVALHAEVAGSRGLHGAPTFVLTHGLCCDHRLWAYQTRLLGEMGRVVTWDMRGHGSSGGHWAPGQPCPPGALSAGRFAADLGSVVRDLATGPVFLVGHSLGGMVSLLALRDDPDLRARVAGAVLIATPTADISRSVCSGAGVSALEAAVVRTVSQRLVGDPMTARAFLDGGSARGYSVVRGGGFGHRPSPTHVEMFRDLIAATPPSVRRATLAAMFACDLRGTLADVDVPTLLVVGGRDRLVNPRQTLSLTTELPRARAVVFSRAGHAVVLERHAAITRRIALLAEQVLAGSGDLDLVARPTASGVLPLPAPGG